MSKSQLTNMVKRLRKAKDRKEKLEADLKAVNADIRELTEQKIPTYMEENEIEKHTVAKCGTVFIQTKVYAHVKAENRPKFFDWLREHGNDDLIKETVHPSTLNAFAKEQLSEGKPLPDEIIEARLYPTATLRRT